MIKFGGTTMEGPFKRGCQNLNFLITLEIFRIAKYEEKKNLTKKGGTTLRFSPSGAAKIKNFQPLKLDA